MEPLTNPVADPSGTDAEYQADQTQSARLRITEDQWAQHKEVVVSYAVLRASIEGYYKENVDHKDQTDKLVHATMDCLDKNSTERADLLKALNGVTKTLKVVQEAVKDDHALNKKATAISQDQHLAARAKSSTSMAWNLGLRLTAIESQPFFAPSDSVLTTLAITATPAGVEGENVANTTNKEPSSHTEGSMLLWRMILRSLSLTKLRKNQQMQFQYQQCTITNDEINALIEKEDKIKKDVEEAKMFEMTKTEVIKVVQEEAEKIGVDPKIIVSVQLGEKFKKAQDVEHQVLKREHSQKVKRLMELNKKRAEQYMWTISSRLKPENSSKLQACSTHSL
ncbi:hypothetical protein Tco_1058263 [Tanacetum coccineum]|uniref:Uncharacterized protein n=1 Tax=Tanacetum coccineum TaxID=301880 RepID=A0ABQ5H8N5_9ASTR